MPIEHRVAASAKPAGTTVEAQLTDRAPATRDLDLALDDPEADQAAVRDALVEALQSDPQADFFE